MNVRKRILLAWAEAVGFTSLCFWLTPPTALPRLFALSYLLFALFMTRIQLEKIRREVFSAEPKWLRVFIPINCLVMAAGLTIMVLRGNFSIGPERLEQVAQVLSSVGSLGCIVWFVYEDGRLFCNVDS